MYISTLLNVEWGDESLLDRWTGSPDIRKVVKRQFSSAYILRREQDFCSAILHFFLTFSTSTVLCTLYS